MSIRWPAVGRFSGRYFNHSSRAPAAVRPGKTAAGIALSASKTLIYPLQSGHLGS